MIQSGTIDQLKHASGDWCFADMGFASKAKSCGYLFATIGQDSADDPQNLTFGELGDTLVSLVTKKGPPLHLVLEAPISSAFTHRGNPTGRSIEKIDSKTRYWYVGLGCSVLVSSLFLIQRLSDANPRREIRVFEGFVSFKERNMPTSHKKDVEAMKQVVWTRGKIGGGFCEPMALPSSDESSIRSTLALLGLDPTPPPIIRVNT